MADPYVVSRTAELNYRGHLLAPGFYRVCWGAIFAGVAVALSIQVLLNLLGVGVGFATLDPAGTGNPNAGTLSMIGAIWAVVAGLVAAFAGGFVASRMTGGSSRSTGGYQGLITWATTTLFIAYLLTTTAGAIVGGAFSALSNVVGGAAQTAAAVVTTATPAMATIGDPFRAIEGQIRETTGGADPEALRASAVDAVRAVVTGDEASANAARTRAAEAIARAQNIPVDQAQSQVQQYEQAYRKAVDDAEKQALEAANVAATAISTAAITAFVSLLAGAIAGWIGGVLGARKPDENLEAEKI